MISRWMTGARIGMSFSSASRMLGEARAIVTPVPGTTRDTIEESLTINGLLFRLVDTAGLRRATDPVEAEGVDRTRHQLRYADIVVLIEDASGNVDEKEIESALHGLLENQHLILVFNKIDLLSPGQESTQRVGAARESAPVLSVSARTGEGIAALKASLAHAVHSERTDPVEGVVVTNQRHHDALKGARESLKRATEAIQNGRSNEFIALDVREATERLGEITGEVTTEDVLSAVFSRFCIGK